VLKAIASIASAEKSSVVPTTTGPSATDAERRQVTVMFSDLVGSTALAARMDPEDLREVMFRPQGIAAPSNASTSQLQPLR
jgi:class 3 adenylate cyclase